MKGARALLNMSTVHALREALKSSLSEVPKYTNTVKARMIVRLSDANDYYKNITGMDELDRCQQTVTNLQNKLLEAQEKRREIGLELTSVRKKSNEVQDQLHKVKRHDNLQRFLDLMKEETELLKQEHDVTKAFQEQDRAEREIFSAFTNAIRDSHERQRTHLERTKYWGMILSIVGSFVSFSLSSLRTEDLKKTIATNMRTNYEPVVAKLEENERVIMKTMTGIKGENMKLLQVLNSRLNDADIKELNKLEAERVEDSLVVYSSGSKLGGDKLGGGDVLLSNEMQEKSPTFTENVVTISILVGATIFIMKLLGG